MRIIEQYAVIEQENDDILKQLEERGRICYKTEDRITEDSAPVFASKILKNGHNSVLEMAVICIDLEVGNATKFMTVGNGMTLASVRAWREYFTINGFPIPLDFAVKYGTLFSEYTIEDIPGINIVPMPANDLNHTYVCARLITNRAVTHEIVRHRPSSYLQESQRYVKYDSPEGIEWIRPVKYEEYTVNQKQLWVDSCLSSEIYYTARRKAGQTPQQARGSLANDCKTEILVYCNLREWRHIFFQRSQGGADPQMIALMKPLLEEFRVKYHGHFDTLSPSVG